MENTVKLSEVLNSVRKNGHLGYIKILKPKNQPKVKQIDLSITLFKKKYVNKVVGDEILTFDNKELNITELENILKRYIGNEVSLFIGNVSYKGLLISSGGYRENSGAKPKYLEPTKTTAFRIPISKIDEVKEVVNEMLRGYAENNQ